jgi:hypothetical protein
MGAIGKTYPAYLPPYSTVYWHYKQWRATGVFEELMSVLHGQVREQVKKNRTLSTLIIIDSLMGEKYLQCQCGVERFLFLLSPPMALKGI